MLSMIVAFSQKTRAIGFEDGGMPWHCPEDLSYFRKMTMGKIVIMGRKTYESLPGDLLGRTIYVLTRDETYDPEKKNVTVFHNVEKCIMMAELKATEEVIVAGGGEIYRLLLPYTDTIYATELYGEYKGGITFPELATNEWTPSKQEDVANETLHLFYCRTTYRRIR